MKIPLRWLHEMLSGTPSASEVASALGSVGIEVSALTQLGAGFENVVVAGIEAVRKHPNADKLSLCDVTDGRDRFAVVCGASNMSTGDLVALARSGAKLPCGMEIRRSRIRGENSEGMLCSEAELKLSEESEGILILPPGTPIGSPLAQALGMDDWLIELEITPNRGDCLSVMGVAREAAAALNIGARVPTVGREGPSESTLAVSVDESEGCPRYVLRLIDGLRPAETPAYMRDRLRAAGFRAVHPVVDITNYVLLEWGQPMHAFDRAKVKGRIRVRRAAEGERLVCLDEVDRALSVNDLLIADDSGPIALAGVIGGLDTAVSRETQAVLLESAYFDPRSIRRTCRRLNLSTESSYRFERNVDLSGAWDASTRAVELLEEICLARHATSVDLRSRRIERRSFRLRKSTIARILGKDIQEAGEYLARLGCAVEKEEESWRVETPTHRADLEREIDLVEEVARLHGYGRFPSALPAPVEDVHENAVYDLVERVTALAAATGLFEVYTYSFAAPRDNERFGWKDLGEAVEIANPVVAGASVLRQSLLPGLLAVWRANLSRQTEGAGLFEVGLTFGRGEGGPQAPAREVTRFTALLAGDFVPPAWYRCSRRPDFADGRGLLEFLAMHLRLGPLEFHRQAAPAYLHPGKSALVFRQDRLVGAVGALHPSLSGEAGVENAIVADLSLEPFVCAETVPERYSRLSPFPVARRDLAFLVPVAVSAESVQREIEGAGGGNLLTARTFDCYEGKGVPKGFRNLAFRLTFGSMDRTLKDSEVESFLSCIVSAVEEKCGAKLRST